MTAASHHFISVIIPTYCRPVSLRRCIASLGSQEYPQESFEVIVVDDGGDPPAAGGLSGELPRGVQPVLIRQSHQGAAVARTRGIERARGEILAFLDDDCSVPPDYLAVIDRVFQVHPETQVVQVGLDNPEPGNIYARAWKFALDETLKINLHPSSDGRLTSAILGGVMVARRDIFTEVGFEAAMSLGREDADLRYQLQSRNVPVYYEPRIRVLHHYRRTLRSYLAPFLAYGRGEFHLRRKWGASPPPFRYVSLTSWRALRFLVGSEGLRGGVTVYCILWLKRHAGLCGVLYETAAKRFPEHWARRWTRFGWLLVRAYTGQAVRFCRDILRRGFARLGLTK